MIGYKLVLIEAYRRVVEPQCGLGSVIGVFECSITQSPRKIGISEYVVLDEELIRNYAVPR